MTFHVLVVSAAPGDIEALKNALEQARDGPFCTAAVGTMAAALAALARGHIDAVLADLYLPDSDGLATFHTLYAAAPDVPIMILVAEQAEPVGVEAVEGGAQGYLSKGYFSSSLVPQALRSIIVRKAIESSLYIERERSKEILEAIGEAVVSTDLNHNVIYLNAVAERMTGWSRDAAQGHPIADVARVVDSCREPTWGHFFDVISKEGRIHGATGLLLIHRDGHENPVDVSVATVHDRGGKMSGAVAVLHDTRAADAANVAKLAYFAQHDFLTHLPNRMLLGDRIGHEIALAKRNGTLVAVMFLDLDNFKHINDSLGHSIGDALLKKIAKLLTEHTRSSDTVCRQGGDEFIIVSPHDKSRESIAATAGYLLAQFTDAQQVAGHRLHITPSIGISVFPLDGGDAETLVKNADAAMYCAKKSGRNTFRFFDQSMNDSAVERQLVEAHLRHGLDNNEFLLHYQPKINLATRAITGAEALLRWNHPERGLMYPDQFIHIAEEAGIIGTIGRWALARACGQVRAWQDLGLDVGTVAVNVSASEFRSAAFVDGVRAALAASELRPGTLELELTEGVLMDDVESSAAALASLKAMGVTLTVDDFGTGYSSLSYLSQFPIDVLKIDQSFMHDLRPGVGNANIISAVIVLGHSLQLKVIAEGVEAQQQFEFLRTQQCDEGQGFYFGAALPAEQFTAILRDTGRQHAR
jgi:diguanylate cyclase (GGDEF)-like protein/PAS domain S-box-containing protein